MRIAVVASPVTPLRPAQPGGAQAMVCDLALGLARRGHEVAIHCVEGSEVPGVELITVPPPRDAVQALVMPMGRPSPPTPGVAAAIAEMFEGIRSTRPDVVSQHAFDAPAFDLARGLAALHTLHLPPLVPAVVAAAASTPGGHLATVSASMQRAWRAAGVEVGRVLRNGVEDIDLPDGAPQHVALVAGRISPEKGIEDALSAASVAGLPVRVAGAVYDPAYEVDLHRAERLGELTRLELRRVMAASAVTICAVRWEEPFGLVAAESQMAGCPVAAYNRGALPEVVEDGVSGFLATPDDVAALATAIERCLALDRREVRASARRRLGLDGAIDGYEAALTEIASS
jgi:UDP-glucose:tetrahydrobiopterin glucosyltransferase